MNQERPVHAANVPGTTTKFSFMSDCLRGQPSAPDSGRARRERMGRGTLRVRVTKDGFSADLVAVHVNANLAFRANAGGRSQIFSSRIDTLQRR
jgi:hypothetical protein